MRLPIRYGFILHFRGQKVTAYERKLDDHMFILVLQYPKDQWWSMRVMRREGSDLGIYNLIYRYECSNFKKCYENVSEWLLNQFSIDLD